jgi:hypothetical protein
MPPTQFDPDLDVLFSGEFTEVTVIDPAQPGQRPNLVLDPTKAFEIEVKWRLKGPQVPLYLAVSENNWTVTAYAESMGPGADARLSQEQEPKANVTGPSVNGDYEWSHKLTVPANTLQAEDAAAGVSGTYKIVATVFLNSTVSGFDIAGFYDGALIKMENR